jgi:hypothetical protein
VHATKTSTNRTAPLHPVVASILKEHAVWLRERCVLNGDVLVFPSRVGTYRHPTVLGFGEIQARSPTSSRCPGTGKGTRTGKGGLSSPFGEERPGTPWKTRTSDRLLRSRRRGRRRGSEGSGETRGVGRGWRPREVTGRCWRVLGTAGVVGVSVGGWCRGLASSRVGAMSWTFLGGPFACAGHPPLRQLAPSFGASCIQN